ncbi:serine/threonine-protein kinase Nek1-like [Lytechinus variegatus]|uniref:serine/threonine-protein kinase Nek1-like n=1 Tax=Lytechinus variegatus TaxID=7654 RepID=UPI001BB22F8F|nr:serine/threonine-protein kinase Nek1-like [Lytechinus variegatus]XP_041484792.1 serine/threonine-protein kinase Nek1-like [Lytechinus variegatus]
MEKYMIIDTFAKGPQGITLLVKHRANGKTFILKKIECNDNPEANRALREVMRFTKLRHRHIAIPRDAFVHWDSTEAAVYLCIASDYFVTGDLDSFVKEKSRNGQSMCESDMQRWMGQMLHAIIYLHDSGIAHTNLKPSNVYLTPQMDLRIGDIGIRTVIEDLHRFRSRTRSAVWSLYWSPPEVFEGPHGSKTDVWSLGCMLFEMAAMMHQSVLKSREVLLQLRVGDRVEFLDSLKQIGRGYEKSCHICDCLVHMFSADHESRPSARDVLKMHYPRLCINMVTNKGTETPKR